MANQQEKEKNNNTINQINMSENQSTAIQKQQTVKSILDTPEMKARMQDILGSNASVFAVSVVQLVNQAASLRNCDPKSVINCAMVATTLNLSISPQLGQAWVVPYGKTAQFQIGVKGLKQLAMRSGQFLRLNAIEIHENQFIGFNPLTEELTLADLSVEGNGKIVGYCAYMKLVNGFEKTIYWTKEKAEKHGKKYSKTFASGPWKTEFDKMAIKTVMKALLNSGEAPLSIEMQRAMNADQAVIKDVAPDGEFETDYPDNMQESFVTVEEIKENEEANRLVEMINSSTSIAQLDKRLESFSEEERQKHESEILAKREELVKE